MDTLIAQIDAGVEAALKAEAERYAHQGAAFDPEDVERVSEHVWDHYVTDVNDNPARPQYVLDMGAMTYEDILDSYREACWSAYEESRIG